MLRKQQVVLFGQAAVPESHGQRCNCIPSALTHRQPQLFTLTRTGAGTGGVAVQHVSVFFSS